MKRVLLVLLLFVASTAGPTAAQRGEPLPKGPRDLREDLFLAIEMNDLGQVREVLLAGAHTEVSFGIPTPLGTAVGLNQVEVVRLLLRAGGNPAEMLDNPLPAAIRNDNPEMLRLLLGAGAPFPGRDAEPAALYADAMRGNNALEILRELMDHGADPAPALPAAARRGDLEIVRFLLRAGAPVNGLPLGDQSNLVALCKGGDELSSLIADALSTEASQPAGFRAETLDYFLRAGIATGDRASVQAALDQGGQARYEHLRSAAEGEKDVIAEDLLALLGDEHDVLLSQAEADGSEALTAFLQRTKTQRNLAIALPVVGGVVGVFLIVVLFFVVRNSFFHSPRLLHSVVEEGKHQRAAKLLKSGADANVLQGEQAPLHLAAQNGDLKMARLLIDHGARPAIKAKDDLGFAPLHIAASLGHIGLAELLLRSGAHVESRDALGQTPLFVAATAVQSDMMSFLIERGANPNARLEGGVNLLAALAVAQDRESVQLLLDMGADPNGESSQKPILEAAKNDDVELVQALLDHGADAEVVDLSGATALEIALRQGNEEVVTLLRRYGAREPGNLRSIPVAGKHLQGKG